MLGAKVYSIRSATKRTIQIEINARGRAMLANRTSLNARVRLVAAAGAGIAKSSKTTITLRVPKL